MKRALIVSTLLLLPVWIGSILLALAISGVASLLPEPVAAQVSVPPNARLISCVVTVSTATTLTAVGGECAAPGAGLSIYVTDILFSTSASGIGADAFATLKYGTGGTCGTGTTVFWGALSAAANITTHQFISPRKIPVNNEICWITSTAGSKFVVISGFIAP